MSFKKSLRSFNEYEETHSRIQHKNFKIKSSLCTSPIEQG